MATPAEKALGQIAQAQRDLKAAREYISGCHWQKANAALNDANNRTNAARNRLAPLAEDRSREN
jgi:hypothetical protein